MDTARRLHVAFVVDTFDATIAGGVRSARRFVDALRERHDVTVVNRAESDRVEREIRAVAQAALFTNQIPAFEAAPSVYAQRAFLQTFARATANARKYVLLTTNTHDVLQFDLQDSVARDLLQMKPPEAKK